MRTAIRAVAMMTLLAALVFGTAMAQGGVAAGQATIAEAQSASNLFQQARHTEEVVGDLQQAIEIYQRIVGEHAAQREVVARALVRMGACYEKLGDQKARQAYARVVSEFTDQSEAVTEARDRLAVLDSANAEPVRSAEGSAAVALDSVLPLPEVAGGVYAELQRISPDATRVSFLGIGGTPFGQTVGVYDYRDGSTTWMTEDGSRRPADGSIGGYSAWSADGERLAYTTHAGFDAAGATLWVARPGQTPTRVFDTRPGESLAVSDWFHDGSAVVIGLQRADQSVAIGIVSLEDGSFRQLKTLNWPSSTVARVSPDGRYIVFEDGTRDARDLFIIAADGSSPIVTLDDHAAFDQNPLWSPDGTHIVFHSNRQGTAGVWAVAVEDGRPAGEPFPVMPGAEGVSLRGWSEAGLDYIRFTSLADIYTATVDPATGEETVAARMIPYANTGSNFEPAFSPDGRHLAFLTGSIGARGRRSLAVLPLDGGPAIVETPPQESARYAISNIRWKPDGSELSTMARDRQDRPVVLRYTLADRTWRVDFLPAQLWAVIFDWDPSWERFYFYRRGNATQRQESPPGLVEGNLATGEETLIWDPPAHPIRAITTSPDGRLIAMTIGMRLWIFDRRSESATQVPDIRVVPSRLSWSPDSRRLLYVGNDHPGTDWAEGSGVRPDLRVLDLTTGVSTDLQIGEEFLDVQLATPSFAADGEQIAFGVRSFGSEIRLLEDPLAGASNSPATRLRR